ncbi:unnamed protein product, partial [Medioppia subpectinata]
MPYFVMETLSNFPGLPGLFVSCVFSGSLSTLSSGFNALATVTWDDLVKRYFRNISGKKQLLITKFIAMTYGLLAIAIAFIVGRLGTVLQGAICGLVSGVGICLAITIGTIIYPRPKGFQLPVSVTSCPPEILSLVSEKTWMSAAQRQYSVHYEP